MTQRNLNLIFPAILLVYLAVSVVFSLQRPIDGDEGFYCSAARLVSEGKAPYQDFFYPQTPLLPYIYAPVYKIVGSTMVGMRQMSVLAGTAALLCWGLFLRRRFADDPRVVILGLLLVAVNPYFLVWNITVKTYALTNLAVFLCLWAWDRGRQTRNIWWFALVGLAAGLCLGLRLLYGPWVAFLLVFTLVTALKSTEPRINLTCWLGLVAGFAVGLAPTIYVFLLDADLFLFNNVRYHALRHARILVDESGAGVAPRLLAGLSVYGKALLNPFMVLELVLAGLGIRHLVGNRSAVLRPVLWLSVGGFVAHSLAGLVPTPSYDQYFTGPLTPMLAPLLVAGVLELRRLWNNLVPALVIVAGIVLAAIDLGALHHGMDQGDVWQISHQKKVAGIIEQMTEPDDMIMAFWSGYPFESGRQFIPGMENHFGVEISEHLTLPEKLRYHICNKELLLFALENQTPSLLVLGVWMNGINVGIKQKHLALINEATRGYYEPVKSLGNVDFAIRRDDPEPLSR